MTEEKVTNWPTPGDNLPYICDSCGFNFSVETAYVECENDSQIADDEFEPSEDFMGTTCANEGWMKIEHDLGRNLIVHQSCFLEHDDILVRV